MSNDNTIARLRELAEGILGDKSAEGEFAAGQDAVASAVLDIIKDDA